MWLPSGTTPRQCLQLMWPTLIFVSGWSCLRLGAPPVFPTGWVFRLGGWPAELFISEPGPGKESGNNQVY